MKLWQRFLFRHLLSTFLFFLVSIFLVYVIVDLSAHGALFLSSETTTLADIGLYYLRNFSRHLELFFPLTLLLTVLKVLLDLNIHQELVALQTGGLSKKRILRPFFLFASFLALLSYANSEWLSPDAQDAAQAFKKAHAKKHPRKKSLYTLALRDDSELIYHSFDDGKLSDAFWVRSIDDIWHIKFLKIGTPPQGSYVDHLQRSPQGLLEKTESFVALTFPQMLWDESAILARFVPFEHRPLSTLFAQATSSTAERYKALSHLHYKLALPMLHFLLICALAPASMRFTRRRPAFLIVTLSLTGLIALMTVLNGMLILGETQVIPASFAIWGPLAVLFLWTVPRFAKL